MIFLGIGSINQATAIYPNADGEGLSVVMLDEATLETKPVARYPIANPSFLSIALTSGISPFFLTSNR